MEIQGDFSLHRPLIFNGASDTTYGTEAEFHCIVIAIIIYNRKKSIHEKIL